MFSSLLKWSKFLPPSILIICCCIVNKITIYFTVAKSQCFPNPIHIIPGWMKYRNQVIFVISTLVLQLIFTWPRLPLHLQCTCQHTFQNNGPVLPKTSLQASNLCKFDTTINPPREGGWSVELLAELEMQDWKSEESSIIKINLSLKIWRTDKFLSMANGCVITEDTCYT